MSPRRIDYCTARSSRSVVCTGVCSSEFRIFRIGSAQSIRGICYPLGRSACPSLGSVGTKLKDDAKAEAFLTIMRQEKSDRQLPASKRNDLPKDLDQSLDNYSCS